MGKKPASQIPIEAVPMTGEWSEEKNKDGEKNESGGRERWSSHLDYMLAQTGYCVGLGNLWRFPYLCNRNGGGAFLIPFIFFLFVCAVPLFFLEAALGQFSGRSSYGVWEICPLFKGIGIGVNIMCTINTIYYNALIAWSLYYLARSCASVLPWTTCDNPWNTKYCFLRLGVDANASTSRNVTMATVDVTATALNVTKTAGDVDPALWGNLTLGHTAAEEFWQYETLKISGDLGVIGTVQWQLALCILAAWIIVGLCLIKGIKSAGKVAYVTATAPYVLLTILFIRELLLEGAVDGIIFYVKPNFRKLLEVQVWLEAATQVFYSLGPAYGSIITMASYNQFHNNCLRDSIVLSVISEGTSMFSGLVVFAMLGYMAREAGVPISDVVSSGPGLGFVVYPESLSTLPVPQLWSVLFFLVILSVGLDSMFTAIETYLTTVVDAYPHILRKRRSLLTIGCCLACFVLSLIFVTNGGIYVFQLLDWYLVPFTLFSVATLECVIVAWIYGMNRFDRDVKMMLGRETPLLFRILICYVVPVLMMTVLVTTMAQYSPPTYGKYVYPGYAEVVGWVIMVIPILPIPAYMAWDIWRREGPIKERFRQALRPSCKWQPSEPRYQEEYHSSPLPRRLPLSVCVCGKVSCRQ